MTKMGFGVLSLEARGSTRGHVGVVNRSSCLEMSVMMIDCVSSVATELVKKAEDPKQSLLSNGISVGHCL